MTNMNPLAISWISFGFVPLDIIRGQLVRASFPLMHPGYHVGSGTAFSIKQIIGIKGNYASVRMGDMDPRSSYRSHIEVIGIHKLDNHDSKDILVAQASRNGDQRQATQELLEGGGGRSRRMTGGKQVKNTLL